MIPGRTESRSLGGMARPLLDGAGFSLFPALLPIPSCLGRFGVVMSLLAFPSPASSFIPLPRPCALLPPKSWGHLSLVSYH